jgi:ABC-type branched-subunit amino acid transport system permease subunit
MGPPVLAAMAGAVALLAYAPFFGRRNDYPGHFTAGFASTLILLVAVGVVTRRPLGWWAVAALGVAIGIGAITEATIFRLAIFDPVDFCNQSLGATIAAASLLGAPVRGRTAVALIVTGCVFLVVGFVVAFS